jgi:cytochrome c oxidase subunit 2
MMIACAALFVVAPFVGWWLPKGVSSHAADIDFLYYLILAITGFFFILTEALLVYFMFRYAEGEPGEVRSPSAFRNVMKPLTNLFNTATKVEMAWTVVPAVILLYLAFAQVSAWAEVKYKSRLDKMWAPGSSMPLQVALSARQFEWRFRYPNPATWEKWKKDPKLAEKWVNNPEIDDVQDVPNELHVIKGRHCVVQLSTKDVIHSFNIPAMRVKQDALPGKTIPVWFKPNESNVFHIMEGTKIIRWVDGGRVDSTGKATGSINPETGRPADHTQVWEIACAELCGWGHYRMVGRVYVHDTEQDFLAWLNWAAEHQNDHGKSK